MSKCDPNHKPSYSWRTIYYGDEFQLKLKKYAESLTAPDYYKGTLKPFQIEIIYVIYMKH